MYKKVHMEGELSVFHKQSSKRPGEMYNMSVLPEALAVSPPGSV